MDMGKQWSQVRPIKTGSVPLNFKMTSVSPIGVHVYEDSNRSYLGGAQGAMKAISSISREEPVSADETAEYGVVGSPMRDVGSKEGRSALAKDLGLPNKKARKRRK